MIAHINPTRLARSKAVNFTALQLGQSPKMMIQSSLSKTSQPNLTFKIQVLYLSITKTKLYKSESHPKQQNERSLLVKLMMILILSWCSSKMGCQMMFQSRTSKHLKQIKIGKLIQTGILYKSKKQGSFTIRCQKLNQF